MLHLMAGFTGSSMNIEDNANNNLKTKTMQRYYDLVNVGSVQDISASLKCSPDSFSIAYLRKQLKKEAAGRNRATVKKMLTAAIIRKVKTTSMVFIEK